VVPSEATVEVHAMAAVLGERIPGGNATFGDVGRRSGGFILITGIDGIRYAVRQHSVAIIHDADECHDETLVQLYGGAVVRVPCTLDEVLAWFV
jgi:hypothetical protein